MAMTKEVNDVKSGQLGDIKTKDYDTLFPKHRLFRNGNSLVCSSSDGDQHLRLIPMYNQFAPHNHTTHCLVNYHPGGTVVWVFGLSLNI